MPSIVSDLFPAVAVHTLCVDLIKITCSQSPTEDLQQQQHLRSPFSKVGCFQYPYYTAHWSSLLTQANSISSPQTANHGVRWNRNTTELGSLSASKNNLVSSLTQDKLRGKSTGGCCKCGSNQSSSNAQSTRLWQNQAWRHVRYKPLNQSSSLPSFSPVSSTQSVGVCISCAQCRKFVAHQRKKAKLHVDPSSLCYNALKIRCTFTCSYC